MNSRGFRSRRRFRLPWWGWVILVLVILSPFAPKEEPERVRAAPPAPVSAAPVPTPPAAPAAPTFPQAADILALGRTPAAQVASESSVEDDRRYYTFDRPDLGESVQTVWIAPDDWWVKISGVAFDPATLGSERESRFTQGPLEGLIQNSRFPDRVLHIMTDKWAARIGQAP